MRLEVWTIMGRAFHFGRRGGLGMEDSAVTWPSDSLFAALVARLAAREGPQAVAQAMRLFLEGNPPFLITSTFPCICPNGKPPILLFPVPLAALRPKEKPPEGVQAKDLKRVRFVSEGVFRALLEGQSLAEVYPEAKKAGHKSLLFTPEEWARLPGDWQREGENLVFWRIAKRPRVTVDRITNMSNLFHVGAVHFRRDAKRGEAGLWFGVHWRREDAFWSPRFEALLSDLADAGLGAERSAGYGVANITHRGQLDLPDPKSDGLWTTLSRYWPRREEMSALLDERAAYEVVTVGGWVDGWSLRRRPLNLVAEGAVLATLNQNRPYGAVADVRPRYRANPDPLGHPVYRYGYALAIAYGGEA